MSATLHVVTALNYSDPIPRKAYVSSVKNRASEAALAVCIAHFDWFDQVQSWIEKLVLCMERTLSFIHVDIF